MLVDGQVIGFRVLDVSGTVAELFRLQDRDVVRRVNGIELTSPMAGLAVIEAVHSAERIELEILRGETERSRVIVVTSP